MIEALGLWNTPTQKPEITPSNTPKPKKQNVLRKFLSRAQQKIGQYVHKNKIK